LPIRETAHSNDLRGEVVKSFLGGGRGFFLFDIVKKITMSFTFHET
jgi:hypothetical protein